jgi:hypothetical protein
MSQFPDIPEGAPVVIGCFVLVLMIVGVALTALVVWAYCRIFAKAGYSWALGLLMLVPIAGAIIPFVLAFGDWPIHKELRMLRNRQNATPV